MSTKKQEVVVATLDPFIEMVERLATNEAIDTDKLQKLVDIQMQVMDRNAETEFNAAMSRVQANLPTVYEAAYNPQTNSRYAKIEHIAKVIKPIYTAEGFSTTFSQGKPITEGYMGIDGELRHMNGYKRPYWLELPPDDRGIKGTVNKTGLHAAGSTFTYGRRYLTCMMFDVSTGDDTDAVMGNSSPPEAKMISDKQINQIQDMLIILKDADAPHSDESTFCKWAKIDSIKKMPAHKFARCMKRLKENIGNIENV